MKDKGLDKGLIETRDDSARNQRGWDKGFFGFRKMFRDYLKKLHVPFFDECCDADLEDAGAYPVRYNTLQQRLEYFNGSDWVDIVSIAETTSTTTTTSSTTTTTTAPSDIRLKSNIRPTGRTLKVLPEYTWDWNDTAKSLGLDHHRTVGILAQEALEVCPEIVSIGEDGFYRVNYGMLSE
jgi:hypothetical protein